MALILRSFGVPKTFFAIVPKPIIETLVLKSLWRPGAPAPPATHRFVMTGALVHAAPNGLSVREVRAALLQPARDVSGCAAPVNGGPERAPERNSMIARHGAREREIDMRSILAAGLVAGLALASPVLAQDAAGAADPAKAYDAATVLATVNGNAITLGNVIALRDRLPPQYQNLPDDVLMKGLRRPARRPAAPGRRRCRPRRRATRCR